MMDGKLIDSKSVATEPMVNLMDNPIVSYGGFNYKQDQLKKYVHYNWGTWTMKYTSSRENTHTIAHTHIQCILCIIYIIQSHASNTYILHQQVRIWRYGHWVTVYIDDRWINLKKKIVSLTRKYGASLFNLFVIPIYLIGLIK